MKGMDQHRAGEKSGQRKQKRNKKAERKSPKAVQAPAASEPIEQAMKPDAAFESSAAPEAAPVESVERLASFKERLAAFMPEDTAPSKPSVPADIPQPAPSPAAAPAVGIEALANAYRDYTRKSLQDAQSFAEKLSAARSLDKAVEAQTEFARKACETFVTDARKIRELHRELLWQAFRIPGWPSGRTPG